MAMTDKWQKNHAGSITFYPFSTVHRELGVMERQKSKVD
jgi:hypothetical protein